MAVQKKGAVDCIKAHIEGLEKSGTGYAAAKAALNGDGSDNSFVVTEADGKVSYHKEDSGTRVELIMFALDTATSLPALSEGFGKFKALPPTPGGKWAAMARYDVGNAAQTYAIIAESRQKITDQLPITRITVRIDYED